MTERKMKDSGIEWIGKIPEEWIVSKFKNVSMLFTGNSIKDSEKDKYIDSEDAQPYISTKDINVVYRTINYDNGLYIKNNDYQFKRAPKDSTLMCIEGGSAGRKKAKLKQEVSFVNKLCCFYSNEINNSFLYYFLCSPNYEEEFFKHISGLIGGVSVSVLRNINFIVPPLPEQQRIADFLDEKCGEIDALTSDIEEQIKTLEEYKKSVITESVTKGLNTKIEMKDSGIEWIGDIPEHWEIHPVYKYFDERKNSNYALKEQNLLSLSYGKIIRKDINTNGGLLPASFNTYNIVERNDIIIRPTDLQNDKKV